MKTWQFITALLITIPMFQFDDGSNNWMFLGACAIATMGVVSEWRARR